MLLIYNGAPKIDSIKVNSGDDVDQSTKAQPHENHTIWKRFTFTKLELHNEMTEKFSQDTEEELTELSLPLVLSDLQNANILLAGSMDTPQSASSQSKNVNYHDYSEIFVSMDEILKNGDYSMHNTEKDIIQTQIVGETPCTENTGTKELSIDILHMPNQRNMSQLDGLQISSLQSVKDNSKVNLMITVMQKSPTKDILIKHGLNTGNNIKLASILVGDQSDFYITISFWSDHAEWVNKLNIGDLIVITGVVFNTSKNRKVGRTTVNSILYNFRIPKFPGIKWTGESEMAKKLISLYNWLAQHHSYLYSPLFQKSTPSLEEMASSFSQMDEGQLNVIQATVLGYSVDVNSAMDSKFGCFDLEDSDGSKIKLSINHSQWTNWIEKIREKEKPTVRITNILQRYCKTSRCRELFSNQDSVMHIIANKAWENDIELKNYKAECLEFYDEDGVLRCKKDLGNIGDMFDLQPLLYKSCNHCFYPLSEGTANHNKRMQTTSYCPHCSKVYKCLYMFTQLQIQFKKATPKHFGEVQPYVLKTLSPYSINLDLFPNFFRACEDAEFSKDFFSYHLNKDIEMIFTKTFNISVSKLEKDEEELYMLNSDSYIIKHLSII